jgi:hypothetical protein
MWSVEPKLVFFNQMEAPVPEIMDGSLYFHYKAQNYKAVSLLKLRTTQTGYIHM